MPEIVARPRSWVPQRVLLTPAARSWAHGRGMAERAAKAGAEVVELSSDRLPREVSASRYREAKTTLAVVVAPPGKRRPQPIPPSADWRFDLAEGCPAHCQYCYLAGSLKGPPLVRAFANLPEILDGLGPCFGAGTVTSRSAARQGEGTTFEAGCYTDPLGIEHLTGSLAASIEHFGRLDSATPAQLRFTTKFAAVEPLLGLPHRGRTRVRFSVNATLLAQRFEGGTAPVAERLAAMRRLAGAGYPVGLTVAPVMPVEGWRERYDALLADAARALAGLSDLDLTVEFITHRFTDASKQVLQGWYPGSALDMDEAGRARKLTKFGSVKHVYPAAVMRELRAHLERSCAERLPGARVLYWT